MMGLIVNISFLVINVNSDTDININSFLSCLQCSKRRIHCYIASIFVHRKLIR